MNTETMTRTVTTDTTEPVTAPVLPADDRAGDGYDWMDTLEGTAWSVLPNWGSEGWDAGAWPYIIFAAARARDRCGELFGYGTYVEGDTATHWFRSQDACFEAITAEAFFHWVSGQSHGPDHLPATAAELSARTESPTPAGRTKKAPVCPGLHRPGHPQHTPISVDNIIEIPPDRTCPLHPV